MTPTTSAAARQEAAAKNVNYTKKASMPHPPAVRPLSEYNALVELVWQRVTIDRPRTAPTRPPATRRRLRRGAHRPVRAAESDDGPPSGDGCDSTTDRSCVVA